MNRVAAGVCLLGLPLAVAGVACHPGPALAASAARERAALTMLGFVGGSGPPLPDRQPPPPVPLTPDPFMVVDAWRSAGVRVDRTQADYGHLQLACAVARTPDAGQAGPDPQPGDFLLYDSPLVDPATPAIHPRRVAFFVSPVEVVYWDDAQRGVRRAMAVRLLPSHRSSDGEARLVANSSTDVVCGLPPGTWPGGDQPRVGWHYALADPGYVAEQHQWAAAHPRDADTALLHPVAVALGSAAGLVSTALSAIVGAGQTAVGWVLERLGLPGSVLLGAAGLLGTEFDGRRLHRFLTGVLLLPVAAADPGLARIAVGLLGGQSPRELHLGRAGALTRLLVGGAELAVNTLTGVEDSRHVRAGMVVFALASNLLVFGKLEALGRLAASGARVAGSTAVAMLPEGARLTVSAGFRRSVVLARRAQPGLRAAARVLSGRGLRLLHLAGDTSDLVAVRPETMVRTLRSLDRARQALSLDLDRPPVAAPLLELAPERARRVRAVARVGGDALSWVWRRQSASHDAIGHLARYATYADGAHGLSNRAVPGVVRAARLVHLNADGHAALQLISGQPPPPIATPPAPVVLHLSVASQVRRAAELRAQLGR